MTWPSFMASCSTGWRASVSDCRVPNADCSARWQCMATSGRCVNEVHLESSAEQALDAALTIGDSLHAQALAGLTPLERSQLLALLGKARASLVSLAANQPVTA